jgi:hypothetical protein
MAEISQVNHVSPSRKMWRLWLLNPGRQWLNPKRNPRRWVQLWVEEEEKAEAEVEAEPRPEKKDENLGKASPKDISDTHLLLFPHQARKPVEDEKFSRFVEVIRRKYVNIPMLDAMQVPTYKRYFKDILN